MVSSFTEIVASYPTLSLEKSIEALRRAEVLLVMYEGATLPRW